MKEEAGFLALAGADLSVRLFCCLSSPTGKIRSVSRDERSTVLSELEAWTLDKDEALADVDFAFDDIVPVFVFDEGADVFFTVRAGEHRGQLLAWDHETGSPSAGVIATSLEEFVALVLAEPVPILESDVRFSCVDAPGEPLSRDAQLIAESIEEVR